jgi:glycosyltransferase involved in cell wall biosynthesis
MGGLFFAAVDQKSIGVMNKVLNQAKSISRLYGLCDTLFYDNGSIVCVRYENEEEISRKVLTEKTGRGFLARIRDLQKTVHIMIQSNKYEVIYFRDQVWSRHMSGIVSFAKANGIKLFMEIPTYPYYKEQISVSSNKIVAVMYVFLDYLSDFLYFKYLDCIPVVVANSNKKLKKNMLSISNGADTDYFQCTSGKSNDEIDIVGVGYISKYHGFEKVIKSMHKYYANGGTRKVKFYIVGEGPYKHVLEKMTREFDLGDKVYFMGELDKNEMRDIYHKANITVGTLSLQKRGADIDTSLKVVESVVQGIPIIVSGKIQDCFVRENMSFHIDSKDDAFDLIELFTFLDSYRVSDDDMLRLRQKYDWKSVMDNIFQTKGGR